MNDLLPLKLLFIINPRSGNKKTDWQLIIQNHFSTSNYLLQWLILADTDTSEIVKQKISSYNPERVVAVGGDGTIKLAVECLIHTNTSLGIIPAGSANGMAKELGIPEDAGRALDIIAKGLTKKIHITRINNESCIHLSDIGFNAFVIKKFETGEHRGKLAYLEAAWKVLWQQPRMQVEILINDKHIKRQAAMIVVANATQYGTGACINPEGKLDDSVFEVIVVKKVSIVEIYKMMVTHSPFDPEKTEVLQTSSIQIYSRKKAHFQVDGEYIGKVNYIRATIVPAAINIIIP